ncbi:MAG: PAAR domain-containing protein [Actinomycetota bacterium]|nr:PAAR domain-containing protein [Actinomycetota bacterium]
MGQPAAKQGDQVVATDTHIVMIPSPGGPVPTPLPHPFVGQLDGSLSDDVNIEGKPAAVQGSTATNTPSHIPQGGPFQKPPSNKGTVQLGSNTVLINDKPAARNGDKVMTCNDPADLPVGTVVAVGTVLIGG